MSKGELFVQAIDKIKLETGAIARNTIVKSLSEKLEEFESYGKGGSSRNLTRYFTKYIEGKDIAINPTEGLLNALSQFLEYESYADFIKNNPQSEVKENATDIREVNQFGKNNLVIKTNKGEINLS